MSAAFDRLHPAVQHHVVNTLGWASLRPLQEEAIGPVLGGEHALLLAPTAGGKTEAAVLPLLSRMLTEDWRGLGVLYLCPIKALLNNLDVRLGQYTTMIGRRCGLWHGDVGDAARRRLLRDPPDVLLTTPESLESMLISSRVDAAALFSVERDVLGRVLGQCPRVVPRRRADPRRQRRRLGASMSSTVRRRRLVGAEVLPDSGPIAQRYSRGMDVGSRLRASREAAGISQAELARRSGVHQPTISAIERGRRTPRPETFERLMAALARRPSLLVARLRDEIIRAGVRHRMGNVRVFGSCLHGRDTPGSDVDLLVTPEPGASLLDLVAFQQEVEDLLGVRVDAVSDRSSGPIMEAVAAEAAPL